MSVSLHTLETCMCTHSGCAFERMHSFGDRARVPLRCWLHCTRSSRVDTAPRHASERERTHAPTHVHAPAIAPAPAPAPAPAQHRTVPPARAIMQARALMQACAIMQVVSMQTSFTRSSRFKSSAAFRTARAARTHACIHMHARALGRRHILAEMHATQAHTQRDIRTPEQTHSRTCTHPPVRRCACTSTPSRVHARTHVRACTQTQSCKPHVCSGAHRIALALCLIRNY